MNPTEKRWLYLVAGINSSRKKLFRLQFFNAILGFFKKNDYF